MQVIDRYKAGGVVVTKYEAMIQCLVLVWLRIHVAHTLYIYMLSNNAVECDCTIKDKERKVSHSLNVLCFLHMPMM